MERQYRKKQRETLWWQDLPPINSKRASNTQWSADHGNKRHNWLDDVHYTFGISIENKANSHRKKDNLQNHTNSLIQLEKENLM